MDIATGEEIWSEIIILSKESKLIKASKAIECFDKKWVSVESVKEQLDANTDEDFFVNAIELLKILKNQDK